MTNKGTKTSPLDIMYFFELLTIQPPQNKFIARKCIQKSIKKELSANKSDKLLIPLYKLKLFKKLYSFLKIV